MLRCAYRAGLSGEKLDGGWNRACSRDYAIRGDDDDDDDGSDDDDEEKDDDADADGFVNNRSSRDCPGGRERTAVNSITGSRDDANGDDGDDDDDGNDDDDEEKDYDADADGFVNNRSSRDCPGGRESTAVNSITGSADWSCTNVTGCGGCVNSTCGNVNKRETKRLLDELCCHIDSANSGCASIRECGGSCSNVRREPIRLLEEPNPCGDHDDGNSSACCGSGSYGQFNASVDASCANACGGGTSNTSCVHIKREPTRVLEELRPCGGNGDYGTSSACFGAESCGHCRRGDSVIVNTSHRANVSGNFAPRLKRYAPALLAEPRPKRCTPVLLAFGLSPRAALGDKVPRSADDYQSPCASEQKWLSRWKDVFPDVDYRNRPLASIVERSSCLRQGQQQQQQQARVRTACSGIGEETQVEDAVTWEYLWGVDVERAQASNHCPNQYA